MDVGKDDRAAPRRRWARRPSRRGVRRLGAAVLLVVVVCMVGAFLLVNPDRPPLHPADAVIMLAGADDGRHAYAVDLVNQGLAPVLAVSNPEGDDEPLARSICHGDRRPERARTLCFRPAPETTAGEAVAAAGLAESNGWTSVIVVTNRPHTRRASWTFSRCTRLDVQMAPIADLNLLWLPHHLVTELLGFVKNTLLRCPDPP